MGLVLLDVRLQHIETAAQPAKVELNQGDHHHHANKIKDPGGINRMHVAWSTFDEQSNQHDSKVQLLTLKEGLLQTD